jgi:hypothetical protein
MSLVSGRGAGQHVQYSPHWMQETSESGYVPPAPILPATVHSEEPPGSCPIPPTQNRSTFQTEALPRLAAACLSLPFYPAHVPGSECPAQNPREARTLPLVDSASRGSDRPFDRPSRIAHRTNRSTIIAGPANRTPQPPGTSPAKQPGAIINTLVSCSQRMSRVASENRCAFDAASPSSWPCC